MVIKNRNMFIKNLTINGNPGGVAGNWGILKLAVGDGIRGTESPSFRRPAELVPACGCCCCCCGCCGKANCAMNGNIFGISPPLFAGCTPPTFCRPWAGLSTGTAAAPAAGDVGTVLRCAELIN